MIKLHPNLVNFVRPSEHSTFSPSSTDRWMACPFSIKFTANHPPEPESPHARKGTLAHSYCEALFFNQMYETPIPLELYMQLGELGEEGSKIRLHAEAYVNTVRGWLDTEFVGDVLWFGLEKGIPIFPEEGCFGTGDAVIVGTKAAVFIDFKNGVKPVKPDTLQIRSYIAGVKRHVENIPDDYVWYSVIVQPNDSATPKVHEYNNATIDEHLGNIWRAIHEAKRDDLRPNLDDKKHCFWCPAYRTRDPKYKCPAIKERALAVAQENFAGYLADMSAPIQSFTAENVKRDEALLKIIALRPLINIIADDAEGEFIDRIKHGEPLRGCSVIKTTGNRKWKFDDTDEMVEAIKTYYPKVEAIQVKRTVRSITDIEREIGKGKLDVLTTRPIKEKLNVLDERAREALGEIANYGNLIKQSHEDEGE